MYDKLNEVENRFEQIQASLQEPGVANNQARYRQMMKELSDLEKVVVVYREYKKSKAELEGNKEILATENDEDMRAMAKEEVNRLEADIAKFEGELKILLLPKDPNDDKNIILEI